MTYAEAGVSAVDYDSAWPLLFSKLSDYLGGENTERKYNEHVSR